MEKFAALIAIDWADRQHAVTLYNEGTGACERTVVKHTPEALNDWVLSLRRRFGGQPLAVCLEQSRASSRPTPELTRRAFNVISDKFSMGGTLTRGRCMPLCAA